MAALGRRCRFVIVVLEASAVWSAALASPMPCVATPGLAIPSHRQTVPDLAMHGALAVVDEQRAEHEAPKANAAAVAEPDQPPGILQHCFKLVAADHRFIPAD